MEVTGHLRIGRVVRRTHKLDAFRIGLVAHDLEDALEQVIDVERFALQFELAGFDRGEVDHVVDETQQHIAAAFHDLDVRLLLASERRQAQQVGHAEDRIERRTHLVAHRRHELGSSRIRGLCIFPRALQVQREALLFV